MPLFGEEGFGMRTAAKAWLAVLMTGGAFVAREAHATTELQGLYDARSVAMGGTGSSFIENGASVYLNPATLEGVKSFTATAAITPVKQQYNAPLTGPGTSEKSDTPIFPMFLAGAGFRLSERFVAALAVYPTQRVGATYSVNGQENSQSLTQFEVAPAVSFKIIDMLSIGLSYRVTYTTQSGHQSSPAGSTDVSLDGVNAYGAQAGVYFRPLDMLHLALTYRSRVDTSLSGTIETAGVKSDVTSNFNAPHAFRLGSSVALPVIPVIVAADLKYLLYADSNEKFDTTVSGTTTTTRLDWKNSLGFGIGAEVMLISILAIRAGYSFTQSATPVTTAGPFWTPPGDIHALHFGLGVHLKLIEAGVGAMYAVSNKTLAADPAAPTVVPGDYKMETVLLGLSATLHM
jgi:long-subunit fatty acid transport protein